MARMNFGMVGPVSGRVGRVVGFARNGGFYMRAAPFGRTKKASTKELSNRQRFKAAHEFLQPLLPVLRIGFSMDGSYTNAFNLAKSNLLRQAMQLKNEKWMVDMPSVQVSTGNLALPATAIAVRQDTKIIFNWDTVIIGEQRSRDQVLLLAYDIERRQATYSLAGQFRAVGNDMLDTWNERPHHCWMAFVSANRTLRSDSMYLGIK